MPDDPCPLCSAGASTRRVLLAIPGEALDWSTRLFSIECSERWARGASERADDEGRDDLAAKLRGCESGLAHGGDAIRALIQTRARLAEVEAERDAACGIAPDDGRTHTLLLHLTPALLARVEALAYAPGVTPAGVLPWLVDALETAAKERATIRASVGLPPDDPAPNVIEQIRRRTVALHASRSAHETTVGVALRLEALNADLAAQVEELRLTIAAERGDPAGAPSEGWEYGVIDEEGGLGWRKPTADGMLFAWGAGIDFLGADHAPDPHPGGWTRWVADEDGDLDEMPECVTDETWTARAAMLAADKATT